MCKIHLSDFIVVFACVLIVIHNRINSGNNLTALVQGFVQKKRKLKTRSLKEK